MLIRFPLKTACLLLLVFLSSVISVHAQENTEKKIRKGIGKVANKFDYSNALSNGNIVLGAPTDHSITASIILEKNAEAFIEYGVQSGRYQKRSATVNAGTENTITITLDGLSANSLYYYRLQYKTKNEKQFHPSTESWFSTAKKAGSSFSFALQGDSHPERAGKMFNHDLYRNTVDSVAARKPDFYFLMGDDFSADRLIENNQVNRENIEALYKVQRYYWGNAGKNPPLFLVNGNHEQSAKYLLDGSDSNVAVLSANARNKYFPLPAPGRFYSGDKDSVPHIGLLKDYYSFEWGDALFVVIDPYWHSDIPVDNQPGDREQKKKKDPWGITLGKEQYDWFSNTLENSKATYKFVFCHHVSGTGRGGVERARLFEWGGYSQNGNWQFDTRRPGWQMPIHQLMVKNKVTIFFQGHDHLFAKQELDGIIYQSLPNPADDTYTAFNKDAYTSGLVLPNSGFLYITVDPVEVKVEYVRSYLGNPMPPGDEAKKPFSYTIKNK